MLADSLVPKERILSLAFLEAVAYICIKTSYWDSADILIRFQGRIGTDTVKLRSLSDGICCIGAEIFGELSAVTAHILAMYGFDAETGLPCEGVAFSDGNTTPMGTEDAGTGEGMIQDIIDAVNAEREEKIPFSLQEISVESAPGDYVYISIDDIGVKHQKESRAEGSERDYKFVENTVAHIQYGDKAYVLTGIGMWNVFKSILVFLLMNNLLSHELVFLTDGAQDIKSHI